MKKRKGIIAASALASAAACGWLIWDNMRIEIKRYEVSDKNIPKAFDGFKILQVSDLHNEAFGKSQRRLISKIQEEAPDMIAVTGDMTDSPQMKNAEDFISRAVKIAPCYYVCGNHEVWTGIYAGVIKPLLLKYGVKVLDNEAVNISRDGGIIRIAGLADPDYEKPFVKRTAAGRLEYLFERVRPGLYRHGGRIKGSGKDLNANEAIADKNLRLLEGERYTVLLSHRPELFDLYSAHGMELVLTGHAHGGQIRVPFSGRGVIAVDQGIFPKYTEGAYRKGGTEMIVSRGLGNSVYFPRINNCPQLVAVTLRACGNES